jgi:hypothetical protein
MKIYGMSLIQAGSILLDSTFKATVAIIAKIKKNSEDNELPLLFSCFSSSLLCAGTIVSKEKE